MNRIQNLERESKIIKLLKDDFSYLEIAKLFNLSRQRIHQIATRNDLHDRQKRKRDKRTQLAAEIESDIAAGMTFKGMVRKYNIPRDELSYIYTYMTNKSIIRELRKKRNDRLVNEFVNGNTAYQLVEKKSTPYKNPNKVETVGAIYKINRKNGVKRFPMIGNRSAGGSNLSKRLIGIIINRVNKGVGFSQITRELNEKGYKTVTGKVFTPSNLGVLYNAINK